jgi:aminomethyltransferase
MGAINKKTPFYPWHRDHGAALYEKGGWVRPARYEGAREEHLRVRTVGGIIDVHSMGKVVIEGEHAAELLDFAATNDIAGLKVGGARYTCFCAEDGGIVDDVIVYRTGDDRYYLITNTLSRYRVLDFLRGHAEGRRAAVVDVTSATAYIAVQGPRTRELLAAAGIEADLSDTALGYFESAEVDLHGVPVLLARTGYTGELGYELNFPSEYGLDVWEHLCATGAPMGIGPVGGEAMMTLRLEKGYRSYGSDIDLGVNPLEAGLGWVVDWSKADFAGRAALAAARERGIGRRTVYLRAEPEVRLARGDQLLDETGQPVGEVTSGLYGPSVEAYVGLAYVDAAVAVPGQLSVGGEHGGPVAAARRPFFDPAGERLRG